MRRGLVQFLVVAVLVVVVIAGCAVLISRGGGSGEQAEGGGGEKSLTFEQFQSIDLNTTREQIESDYGEPMSVQELNQEQITPAPGCFYYRAENPQFGQYYGFCYEAGILTNKETL